MYQKGLRAKLCWSHLAIAIYAACSEAYSASYVAGSPGANWTEDEVQAVRAELLKTYRKNKQDLWTTKPGAPKVLRLGFHDCVKYVDGTGGCDGCLDWDGIEDRLDTRARAVSGVQYRKIPPTNKRGSNAGLEDTVKWLEDVYTMRLPTGDSLYATGKSRADLWAFATIAAVEFSIEVNNDACEGHNNPIGNGRTICLQKAGEPDCKVLLPRPIVFQTGRIDCVTSKSPSYKAAKQDALPSPNLNGPQLTDFFKKGFGFDGRETVAIMGGHTLGNFHTAVSGFWYTFTTRQETAFNNQYYRNLALKDDWFFEDDICTKKGMADGKKGKAKWMMKSQAAFTNLAPVQWIQHKFVCPNCEWPKTNSWPPGWPHGQSPNVRDSCTNNVKPGEACRPGTERWRFVWGKDEAATNADMGMFYHFEIDDDGFPHGCNELDETEWRYQADRGTGNNAYLKTRRNYNLGHGCGPESHAEPAGSKPLYQIVEEFADSQEAFIQAFVPTLEKMLSNGYSDLIPPIESSPSNPSPAPAPTASPTQHGNSTPPSFLSGAQFKHCHRSFVFLAIMAFACML